MHGTRWDNTANNWRKKINKMRMKQCGKWCVFSWLEWIDKFLSNTLWRIPFYLPNDRTCCAGQPFSIFAHKHLRAPRWNNRILNWLCTDSTFPFGLYSAYEYGMRRNWETFCYKRFLFMRWWYICLTRRKVCCALRKVDGRKMIRRNVCSWVLSAPKAFWEAQAPPHTKKRRRRESDQICAFFLLLRQKHSHSVGNTLAELTFATHACPEINKIFTI